MPPFMRRQMLAVILLAATHSLSAQQAVNEKSPTAANEKSPTANSTSAWLDLRQNAKAGAVQAAPDWVESVAFFPAEKKEENARSVFRIRVSKPDAASNVLFLRLFFNDKSDAHPEIVAWDESGSQLLRSGALGSGIELESSESVMVPMHGVSSIDVEVPGDGKSVRGAYLEWMASSELVHPANAGAQDSVPSPFAATNALKSPTQDSEKFGTVTASLAAESVPIGSRAEDAATFQFGMESQPLMALLSFEIASPMIDTPPEIFVNGHDLGPATLALADLADPAYRGEMRSMISQMQFQYTGWVRAQKIVPADVLVSGTNSVVIMNGANAAASVIRATQIQLKYLWDKSDYILKPER